MADGQSPTSPAAAPARQAGPAPGRPPRRLWRGGLIALAMVLASVLLALAAALYHPAALPWALGQVPGLKTTGVQGTLAAGDLRIDTLELTLPNGGGRLQLDGLAAQRQGLALLPAPGLLADLHLRTLSIDRLHWTSGQPSDTPPALPQSLRLPVSVLIDQLRIGVLQVDQLPPVTGLQARLHLGAQRGARHAVSGLQLGFEQARLTGELSLGADAPLPLMARLSANREGVGSVPAVGATLTLDGPLASLAANLELKGQRPPQGGAAPTLSAQATVAPVAAWPLQALQLSAEALDLSALSPRLPHTALSGNARLSGSAMNAPAQVRASLRNGLPGGWHSGRLPVRQLTLTATGQPNQTDRFRLDAFELLLGDEAGGAGRITGQGRWQGPQADLDLQLEALLPERLDQRAAPIQLSGPITLRATGLLPAQAGAKAEPVVDVVAKLTGRTTDQSGLPVAVQLDGQASARQLLLRSADAAAGQARATAQLVAEADATGWQLKGGLTLQQFNPLPWWPGAADSAWRRGPHRLDGQLALDMHLRTAAATPAPAQSAAPSKAPGPVSGLQAAEDLLQVLHGEAKLTLDNSLLAGLPVQASMLLRSGPALVNADISARVAGNQISLNGQLDKRLAQAQTQAQTGNQLRLNLQMSELAALAPLARLIDDAAPGTSGHWPSAGSLSAEASATGRWPLLRTEGQLRMQGLASADLQLQQASLDWRGGSALDEPLSLKLDAVGLALPPAAGAAANTAQRVTLLSASIDGSLRAHRISLRADSPVRPPAWAENLLGPLGTGTRISLDTAGRWLPEAHGGGRWQAQNLSLQSGARPGTAAAASTTRRAAAPASRATSAAARPAVGPWMTLSSPLVELRLGPAGGLLGVQAQPGRLALLTTALTWRVLDWQAAQAAAPVPAAAAQAPAAAPGTAARLTVQAELETIDVSALLARLQPTTGWGGNLTLGGKIEIRSGDTLDADIALARGGGDLTLTDDLGETVRMGLTDLSLVLSAHDGVWQFAQGLAGERLGQLGGAQVLRTAPGQRFPGAGTPLAGTLEARVADIGVWNAWVPAGWRLVGQLRTSAAVSGTLGAPEFSGEMRGSGIGARNLLQGINLSDGDLAITLAGEKAAIERFVFKSGDGTLSLSGGALLGATPSAQLQLVADKFRVLGRVDRRLVASGRAELLLNAQQIKMDGDLRIDEGLFDISRSDAPSLDRDVVVRQNGEPTVVANAEAAAQNTPKPLRQADVSLRIDLGERLRLKGKGIDTGLRGKLVASTPGGRLALNGSIRTTDGKFAAYGQKMDIRTGEIDFIGPLDNPRINVKALRTDVDAVVGVTVTGTATAPRVRLYSEPDMSEFDKLSWLVMGRAPSGLGSSDTALLQSAALAVMAGDEPGAIDKLTGALGLTDFSLRQSNGDTRETVVTLGKQISQRWYVGYERSVNATTGTWQLIYRAAQRFTLRAQSGADTALDAIWSWRW